MTTPLEQAQDILKGCDGEYVIGNQDVNCGEEVEMNDFKSGCGVILCPSCQAKKQQALICWREELEFLESFIPMPLHFTIKERISSLKEAIKLLEDGE